MPLHPPALMLRAADTEAIRQRLEKAIHRRLPAALASHGDDLVQKAHLRVLRKLSDPEARVNARYLDRVAYCVLVDELRRKREELAPTGVGIDARSQALGPEQQVQGRQLGQAITDCMSAMLPGRRSAVGLYLQGHSVPQAARMLGHPPKTIENRVYRGLRDLRGCLEGKGVRP